MSIGMKRGTVYLEEHQSAWEQSAKDTIDELQKALKGIDADIQHVGSTAVRSVRAKPIIDIAVGVSDLDEVIARNDLLAEYGIIFRFDERPGHLLYVKGDFGRDTRTHHIHVVKIHSREWNNYLNFRDYLNADKAAASEYEAVKSHLAGLYPDDREMYTEEKGKTVSKLLLEAEKWRKQNP